MIWFISSQNFVGSSFPRSLRVVVVLVAMLFSVDKLHKKNRKNSSSKTQVGSPAVRLRLVLHGLG